MKKQYEVPQVSAYEFEVETLLCQSIGGGEPGNGGVKPQSLDWGEDDDEEYSE